MTYKTAAAKVANELLYRHDGPRLEFAEVGWLCDFDGEVSTPKSVAVV